MHAGTVEALQEHLRTRPDSTADDAYKFLHQSVFGPGHMISDRGAAERYLLSEIADLGAPRSDERMCETLGGEPQLVRVHLRPFVASGGDSQTLVDAFMNSANAVSGDSERMASLLDGAVTALEAAGHADLATGLSELKAELAPEGFPAIHHSRPYRDAYRPAYRVVVAELAVAAGWCPGHVPAADRERDRSRHGSRD